jgi:Glyoxalase/Bleomycin resistance protein/Dioxygenase superfamily
MRDLTTVEAKAFVPSKDFALCKQFYQDFGFELAWSSDDLAYLRNGNSSFLLQKFYNKEHADNFMMHLLVEDVGAWWRHVEAAEPVRATAAMTNEGHMLASTSPSGMPFRNSPSVMNKR